MAIYWVMLLLPILATLSPVRADRLVKDAAVFATFVFLVIVIGLRDVIGCDWNAYLDYYYLGEHDTLLEAMGRTEPAYGFLNWTFAKLGWGVYAVNLTCAVIFVYGLFAFCRRQPVPALALAVAVPYMVIVVAMGYTRQAAALGLVMLAFNAFADRRIARFLVLIALAALFHKSSLALAPMAIFLRSSRFTGAPFVSLVAAALLIVFMGMESFDKYMYLYVEREYEGEGAIYRLPVNILAAVVFFIFRRQWDRKYTDNSLNFVFSIIAIALVPVAFINTTIADRVGLYLLPFQAAVFARVPHALGRTQYAVPAILATFGGSAAMLYVWFRYANHAQCWSPYNSLLF